MNLIGIKYVGKKDSHHDHLYGTGLTWEPDQIHAVPDGVAQKLLAHDDTYAAEELPANAVQAALSADKSIPEGEDRTDSILLPNLSGMDKHALQDFALRTFNERLPATMKEETMRTRIQAFANRK